MTQNSHFKIEHLSFDIWKKFYKSEFEIIHDKCIECNGTGYIECHECGTEIECIECDGVGYFLIDKEAGLTLKNIYDNQKFVDKKAIERYNA